MRRPNGDPYGWAGILMYRQTGLKLEIRPIHWAGLVDETRTRGPSRFQKVTESGEDAAVAARREFRNRLCCFESS